MTTIDQRILIPAPPQVVWEYISDIRNNPRWHDGCTSVVFLTSKIGGPGMRWRQTMDKSTEQVIEVTAWYEGLGYQYTYIDGMPFRESTGRLRLQEIPEGTVVQWTISYEVGGVLGGVRNSMGLSRKVETMMVNSLKALWKQVNESGAAQQFRESKSLMRDAPDAEARANYKPRHTPVVDIRADKEKELEREPAQPAAFRPVAPPVSAQDADAKFRPPASHTIPEPAIADDDTRPRQVAEPVAPAEPAVHQRSQLFVEERSEPPLRQDIERFAPPAGREEQVDDTQPIHPISERESRPAPAPDFMDEFTLDDSDFAPTQEREASLTDEINALVYQPESWDEPDAGPLEGIRLTDEINALVVEPDEQPRERSSQPSVTDEINALIADIEAEDEVPEPDRPYSLTDEMNAVIFEASGEAPRAEEPAPAPPELRETPAAGISDDTLVSPLEAPTERAMPQIDESSFPPPAASDTSKLSIWEVFGVPRPSETGEVSAVDGEPETLPVQAEPEPEVSEQAVAAETSTAEAEIELHEPAASVPDVINTDSQVHTVTEEPTSLVTSTGELTIVEVIREVDGPPRRTGLRRKHRQATARVRPPE